MILFMIIFGLVLLFVISFVFAADGDSWDWWNNLLNSWEYIRQYINASHITGLDRWHRETNIRFIIALFIFFFIIIAFFLLYKYGGVLT